LKKCKSCIAVIIFRSNYHDPKLILADEPTGNLDSTNGNEVMNLLIDLNEAGTTIIMVTHSEHDAKYSHRIIRMLDGQKVTENILAFNYQLSIINQSSIKDLSINKSP